MRFSVAGVELEPWSWTSFQAESFQLEAFRTRDFVTAMDGEVAKVITRNNLSMRYLPLVERFCNDLAAQYVLKPTRRFEGISGAQVEKLDRLYRGSRVNKILLEAQQKAQAQNQVLVTVEPTVNPFKHRLHSWVAGEYRVLSKDLLIRDLQDADELVVRVPLTRASQNEVTLGNASAPTIYDRYTQFAHRHYTRELAWEDRPGGDRVGIYQEDLGNPFGIIPAAHAQLTSPRKGYWHSAVAQDLNSVQIGLIIVMSDVEHIARLRAPGRELLTGGGAGGVASKLPAGPEAVWVLTGDVKYQAAALSPSTDKLLEAIRTTINLLATYKYVAQDGLWSSTGITGAAKEAERLEVVENRHRQELEWESFEDDLARVMATMTKRSMVPIQDANLETDVEFHYVKSRQNNLQESQAKVLNFFMGLDSAAEDIARVDGISRSKALDKMKDRLNAAGELAEFWKTLGGAPPGLDSIAGQLGIAGAAGPR